MAIKNFVYQFQAPQLYIVLVLSICYFSLQMVISHITHALTLLIASYHMLCNIFALTGCILTIKYNKTMQIEDDTNCQQSSKNKEGLKNGERKFTCLNISNEQHSLGTIERRQMKLRNTFGWARIDVLLMLVVSIILVSLSLSLSVEALQTLVHIDHQDSMYLPIPVMILGFAGLVLNGICYLLIGGYTTQQNSSMHVTLNGNIILDNDISKAEKKTDTADDYSIPDEIANIDVDNARLTQNRQTIFEIFRDVSSTIFVILCGFIVYFMSTEEHNTKLIDPVLSIFSCIILVTLSYPCMKESCLILLQTIPGSIDMQFFEHTLSSRFPEIISYHDLHIWQLSANKYVSTVHIKFKNQKLYTKMIADVKRFFYDQGITIVTIQPEFQDTRSPISLDCLVKCHGIECAEKVCCQQPGTSLSKNSLTSLNNTPHQIENIQDFNTSHLSISQHSINHNMKLPLKGHSCELKSFDDINIDTKAPSPTLIM